MNTAVLQGIYCIFFRRYCRFRQKNEAEASAFFQGGKSAAVYERETVHTGGRRLIKTERSVRQFLPCPFGGSLLAAIW